VIKEDKNSNHLDVSIIINAGNLWGINGDRNIGTTLLYLSGRFYTGTSLK